MGHRPQGAPRLAVRAGKQARSGEDAGVLLSMQPDAREVRGPRCSARGKARPCRTVAPAASSPTRAVSGPTPRSQAPGAPARAHRSSLRRRRRRPEDTWSGLRCSLGRGRCPGPGRPGGDRAKVLGMGLRWREHRGPGAAFVPSPPADVELIVLSSHECRKPTRKANGLHLNSLRFPQVTHVVPHKAPGRQAAGPPRHPRATFPLLRASGWRPRREASWGNRSEFR